MSERPKYTIKGVNPLPSNRPLIDSNEYVERKGILRILNLEFSFLYPFKILEVAGGGGSTLIEAVQMGLDWHYIDPMVNGKVEGKFAKFQKRLRQLQEDPTFAGRIQGGIAADLPYEDRSFGCVLSCFGVPQYCRDNGEADASLREMIRVSQRHVIFDVPNFDGFYQNQIPIGPRLDSPNTEPLPLYYMLENYKQKGLIGAYNVAESRSVENRAVVKILV